MLWPISSPFQPFVNYIEAAAIFYHTTIFIRITSTYLLIYRAFTVIRQNINVPKGTKRQRIINSLPLPSTLHHNIVSLRIQKPLVGHRIVNLSTLSYRSRNMPQLWKSYLNSSELYRFNAIINGRTRKVSFLKSRVYYHLRNDGNYLYFKLSALLREARDAKVACNLQEEKTRSNYERRVQVTYLTSWLDNTIILLKIGNTVRNTSGNVLNGYL